MIKIPAEVLEALENENDGTYKFTMDLRIVDGDIYVDHSTLILQIDEEG